VPRSPAAVEFRGGYGQGSRVVGGATRGSNESLGFTLAGRSLVGRRAVGAVGSGRQGAAAGRRLEWCGSVGAVAAGGWVSGGYAVPGRVVAPGQSCIVASMVSRRPWPTLSELRHGPIGDRSSTILGRQSE
jgi:hypothetical protein